MKLTREIAYKTLQNFFQQDNPFVLFGTGMSCAVDNSFGMQALKEYLFQNIKEDELNSVQQNEWKSVKEVLERDNDFESAMNNVKDSVLVDKIVELTGNFVADKDFIFSNKIITGETEWPAASLFKKLVEGLSGTDRELHVATTNYDMLAESAFYKLEIPYINGFWGNFGKKLDWKQSKRAITYVEQVPKGKKYKSVPRDKRHIALYKVHGSLNLFNVNNTLLENNAWIYRTPGNIERVIITPGISKYKRLHKFRSELLGKYDEAIEKHNFFLFLGFGFNDDQLNTNTILNKLKNKKCNGLIITRSSNERIEKLLKESDNLWLICKPENKSGTIIKNKKYSNEYEFDDEDLWKVIFFTKIILGE